MVMQCYTVDVHLYRKIIYTCCVRPFKWPVAGAGWKAKCCKQVLQDRGQAFLVKTFTRLVPDVV
jgi:hypothetical protein